MVGQNQNLSELVLLSSSTGVAAPTTALGGVGEEESTCEKRHVRSKPSASSTPASLGKSHSSALAAFCAASAASFSL